MKLKIQIFISIVFYLIPLQVISNINGNDFKVQKISKTISLQYTENRQEFYHSSIPWLKNYYIGKGKITYCDSAYTKVDTLNSGNDSYYSITELKDSILLYRDYGDEHLLSISDEYLIFQLVQTARYSPYVLYNYILKNSVIRKSLEFGYIIESATIKKNQIKFYINSETRNIEKIAVKSDNTRDDELYGFGDVEDIYHYSNFIKTKLGNIPKSIFISKLNNKLHDTICINFIDTIQDYFDILKKPEGYKIEQDELKIDVSVEKYNDYIYFINLHHAGTRSLMVEFENHILIAEAPLNSKNGEILIEEARKLAPNKPIKYFVFGHFHPHYAGGIRPFIHKGAQIICRKEDYSYIDYIAKSKFEINPDSLSLHPRSIVFNEITDKKQFMEKSKELIIYHIGSKSNHTDDYLIYYFPNEKLLYQDDLVWIGKDSRKSNLHPMTIGLYNSIKILNIDVKTIVQNWSVFDRTDKMKFEFKEIEKIMLEK